MGEKAGREEIEAEMELARRKALECERAVFAKKGFDREVVMVAMTSFRTHADDLERQLASLGGEEE